MLLPAAGPRRPELLRRLKEGGREPSEATQEEARPKKEEVKEHLAQACEEAPHRRGQLSSGLEDPVPSCRRASLPFCGRGCLPAPPRRPGCAPQACKQGGRPVLREAKAALGRPGSRLWEHRLSEAPNLLCRVREGARGTPADVLHSPEHYLLEVEKVSLRGEQVEGERGELEEEHEC